nr:MAG TPA_asm: hypothetical protein [Caudoviricetes sp.]DAX12460.1 MAG TPA: hypothetical protein [Caudoviricetes sp.]
MWFKIYLIKGKIKYTLPYSFFKKKCAKLNFSYLVLFQRLHLVNAPEDDQRGNWSVVLLFW